MNHATRARTWPGDDFPSWLSPMVVKELRQGVQSGAFVWTFIGLQGAMFLLMSWGLTFIEPVGGGPGPDFFQFFFWLLLAAGILFVLPLRGLGAVSSERLGNNLDLIRLTRLSATRIVLGKWLAIQAQNALLVVATLPYLVLRYFFGGIDVIRDLEAVGWLFAGSMVVTAGALALSTLPLWVRIATGAIGVPFAFSMFVNLMSPGLFLMSAVPWLGGLAMIALYTVVLLEYAAARIAPVAENHAFRKRTIALLLAAAWLTVAAVAPENAAGATSAFALPLVLAYAVEALLERPVHLASHAAAFARFGVTGSVAARVFTPGWATGLVFAVVLGGLSVTAWCTVVTRFAPAGDQTAAFVAPLLAAAVLFPLPLVVYLPGVRYRLLLYALVQLVSFMAFVYTNAMKPYALTWQNWDTGWQALLPLPLASLASLLASDFDARVAWAGLVAAGCVTVLICLAVLRPWRREMRETRRLLEVARAARGGRRAGGGAGAAA